jgi:hypothetical protein
MRNPFEEYEERCKRAAEISIVDSPWVEAALPLRPWVAPKYALRGTVSIVAGPPSVMKSSLMLAWGCAAALGRAHGDFRPRGPIRALIFNVEDDADEQRRRLSATLRQFDALPADIAGKVICVSPREAGTLFACNGSGEVNTTALMERIRKLIAEHQPDLFIADPFSELHTAEENNNTTLRAVIAQFRALAIEFNMAVVLIHHSRKGTAEPGDPDLLRGGSAIIGGARGVFTALPMSEADAEFLALPKDRKSRMRFFRLDDAKLNYADVADAKWYEKVVYSLDNGEAVPAAVPWAPPDFWRGISISLANQILDEIDAGLNNGKDRYSAAPQATERAAWKVVLRHVPGLNEKQARKIISTWVQNSVLVRDDYVDAEGHQRQGVRVDPANRPR